jgi:hypothetical protein
MSQFNTAFIEPICGDDRCVCGARDGDGFGIEWKEGAMIHTIRPIYPGIECAAAR